MDKTVYAVVDTNVIVSALLSKYSDAYPLQVLAHVYQGNKKHFPKKPFVVTPKEMIEILNNSES